jgi:CIC family chloride channel protein
MAIEVLYSDMEFEAGALFFTLLASIVAYALNGFVAGWEPLFRVAPNIGHFSNPIDYGWFIGLGLAAGVVGVAFPVVFYRVRDQFRRLPGPAWIRPGIGGLLTGVLALAVPQVIGGGYGWIQQAIDGRLAGEVLLLLVVAKLVATTFTVGSGGSGGVFAPSLYIGAMLGGTCAVLAHQAPASFVIVGMAAVFAGAAHVPIASLMMVTEMTGGYTLLVPAALAVLLSYLIQTRLSERLRYRSLYEWQVASRADSPAHHAQHLAIALRLLREREPGEFADLAAAGAIDLVSLLRTGVPVELSRGGRLMVGVLRADSRWVNRAPSSDGCQLDGTDARLVAILRGEHLVSPNGSTTLQAGDRIVYVASTDVATELRTQLDPW